MSKFKVSLAHVQACDCNCSPHKPTCATQRKSDAVRKLALYLAASYKRAEQLLREFNR